MLLIILLLPLFNFILSIFCSKFMGAKGVITMSLFNLSVGFYYVVKVLYTLIVLKRSAFVYVSPLKWIQVGFFTVGWNFNIDTITILMLFVVYFISILVHIYSISYMKFDPQFIRFFSLLSLFTFFMLLLVMSSNLLQIFLGWEGVGLCSYLLINFWFTRVQANKAAIKAMLVNRIGDSFLLLAMIFIFYIFKTFDFTFIFHFHEDYIGAYQMLFGYKIHLYSLVSICLFVAAMGKSAQLGLHTWLPDAMEGPTPVSALIHAATMVTAGVFLLIRLSFFFEFSHIYVSMFVVIIGSLTALFGSIVAVVQNDIKKIIAYSTCSQLGYMFVACGFARYDIALFHLFNHAFFKALLFLSAGLLIYMYSDEQDIRRMGGLNKLFSFIYVMMFFGSYALMGLPFFSGYYSKELILEVCFATYTNFGFTIYLILILAALCTSIYSTRLLYLVFFDSPKGFFLYYKNIKEYDLLMSLVLFILCLFSIFSGFFFKELFVGFGSEFLLPIHRFRFFVDNYYTYEFIDVIYKHIPLFINLLGIGLYVLSLLLFKNQLNNSLYQFLVHKWYFDYLYNYFFIKSTLYLSYYVFYKDLDKNYFEIFGPFVYHKTAKFLSKLFDSFIFVSLFQFLFIFMFVICVLYCLYAYLNQQTLLEYIFYLFNYFLYVLIIFLYSSNKK